MERVMEIEPNEHQIPRFLGKYSSSHSSFINSKIEVRIL